MLIHCIILCALGCVAANPAKEYGKFNLTITEFQLCKGPKQKDCAISKAVVVNGSTVEYDLNVLQNMSPTKGKITAISKGKEFLRLHVKKPCEHLFLWPLIRTLMNVTKDCVVVKGHYKYTLDIEAITHQYFGGTFLFGTWNFKSMFYSDMCNFSCANIQVMLLPVNKKD
ncbi:uncharacterized protein LOC113497404 [Trichoplusia ni]|uniref:Uncharacterized protein LOC113497404 n=1 Tax=Trichoplusia ni TaxID=7111 RepID=A0A7E5VWM8_TRINI|nr:uncharacterized protein LOC113497404 [Trichoplusia ni]